MAYTDSPLATTSSVISILTLVYALGITLQIYVKALKQSEQDMESLVRRVSHGEHGITEMRTVLQGLEAESHMHSYCHNSIVSDLKILGERINTAHASWSKCVRDWDKFKTVLEQSHWGVFGSAKYAPVAEPLMVLAAWPAVVERRAIPWIAVRTAVTVMLWVVAVGLVVPLGVLWLIIALVYNAVVLAYNALVWLDIKHAVQRVQWTAMQGDIAKRMQEVEATIADLRVLVLLRLLERSQRMAESLHDHIAFEHRSLMEAIADPVKARMELSRGSEVDRSSEVGEQDG